MFGTSVGKPFATQENEEMKRSDRLIPGLPDDIAEQILLHLPYPYQPLVRSVSSSWNKTISNPNFCNAKKNLSLALPYIFVFAFHKATAKIQWQAYDPRSRRWFVLPPMPCTKPICPLGLACASISRHGTLFVIGGMRSDTESALQTLISYKTSTNTWSFSSPMQTARSFFAAGSIGGKIVVAGGNIGGFSDPLSTVEIYDPTTDSWSQAAQMITGLGRYDAVVFGKCMYVTEGWTWPFSFTPRGGVYDLEKDKWEEMSLGMREGWTGIGVVLSDRLFVISDQGRVKLYVPEDDCWQLVEGEVMPRELQRPFTTCGIDNTIYVVCCDLDVAIGKVFEDNKKVLKIKWEVVIGPKAFLSLAPSCSQVVYA